MRRVAILIHLAVAATAASAALPPAEDQIRALRGHINAAMAVHDFEAMRADYVADYTAMPGLTGSPLDLDHYAKRLGGSFADPTFVTFTRRPDRIVIGSPAKRAAESGTWFGLWRKDDGIMRRWGIYQAMWVPTPVGWRLKNESFISLRCVGSRACAQAD